MKFSSSLKLISAAALLALGACGQPQEAANQDAAALLPFGPDAAVLEGLFC